MRFALTLAAALALLALTGCGSSSTPTATPVTQAAPPAAAPVAKAPMAVPVDETDAAKGVVPATQPAAGSGSSVPDKHQDSGKTTPATPASVTVHPRDPKQPLKCAPPDKADGSCKENGDGSLQFTPKPRNNKPPGTDT